MDDGTGSSKSLMDPRAEMVLISVALLLAAYLTGVAVEVLT
jgi:hypothetical protein